MNIEDIPKAPEPEKDQETEEGLVKAIVHRPPEEIFDAFCKAFEMVKKYTIVHDTQEIVPGVKDSLFLDSTAALLETAPLFLFTREKVEKAMEYVKSTLSNTKRYILPFKDLIISDSIGTVAILDARFLSSIKSKLLETPHAVEIYNDTLESCEPLVMSIIAHLIDIDIDNTVDFRVDILYYATVIVYISKEKKHSSEIVTLTGAIIGRSHTYKKQMKVRGFENIKSLEFKLAKLLSKDAMHSLFTALEELLYVVQPYVKTLKRIPNKERKNSKKLLRHADRERIIIIDPDELKNIYEARDQQDIHSSPIPHRRIGHWRTFHHPKFGNMVGKSIWIDEMNINAGEEFRTKGRVYKVMDLTRKETNNES